MKWISIIVFSLMIVGCGESEMIGIVSGKRIKPAWTEPAYTKSGYWTFDTHTYYTGKDKNRRRHSTTTPRWVPERYVPAVHHPPICIITVAVLRDGAYVYKDTTLPDGDVRYEWATIGGPWPSRPPAPKEEPLEPE